MDEWMDVGASLTAGRRRGIPFTQQIFIQIKTLFNPNVITTRFYHLHYYFLGVIHVQVGDFE